MCRGTNHAAAHLELSLIWLSLHHPRSTPNSGSQHLLGKRGSSANVYKEERRPPTLGSHPAPFSPMSQLEGLLLALRLLWWPHSHLIWSPDSTSPYP